MSLIMNKLLLILLFFISTNVFSANNFSCNDCNGYCKDISSCDLAFFCLTKCNETRMDRDNDQIPCENVCTIPKINGIKSNIIFDLAERSFPQYFFPHANTNVNNVEYLRVYNNQYKAALITKDTQIHYGFHDQWNHFGTLEDANRLLCNNSCW